MKHPRHAHLAATSTLIAPKRIELLGILPGLLEDKGETDMSHIFNRSDEKQKRRELRHNMPPAEVIVWSRLQRRQLHGYKFRRQFSVGPFVLDFYSTELKLAIELDGDSHFRDGGQTYDASRDEYIAQFGIRVLRVLNMEVFENLDGVIEYLSHEVLKRAAERNQSSE